MTSDGAGSDGWFDVGSETGAPLDMETDADDAGNSTKGKPISSGVWIDGQSVLLYDSIDVFREAGGAKDVGEGRGSSELECGRQGEPKVCESHLIRLSGFYPDTNPKR